MGSFDSEGNRTDIAYGATASEAKTAALEHASRNLVELYDDGFNAMFIAEPEPDAEMNVNGVVPPDKWACYWKVYKAGSYSDSSKNARSAFVLDPATGALVLRPDLGLKFEKALRHQARLIALRLYLPLLPLYLIKLYLNAVEACLRIRIAHAAIRLHTFRLR